MNIAFLCRWKLDDGLTVSTVLPHLQALVEFGHLSKIILITLEDKANVSAVNSILSHPKIQWFPFFSAQYKSKIVNQVSDHFKGYKQLRQVVKAEEVDLVIAHGAPAGAIANKALEESDIPYFVTLFEPHADYMLESDVWSKYSLKYKMQKYWESLQEKHAAGLLPVTEGFRQKLVTEGVSADKIKVVPCSVDSSVFQFDIQKRAELRKQLGWEKAIVGIYVGKYSGLYYDDEAFGIYQKCFALIPDFRLLILSPQPKDEILQQLYKYKLDLEKVYVSSVDHQEVPGYLSAADFAFATYKPGPSKKYLSPVKVGEYWANGLPVLLTEGVGDDSEIIKNEGVGALFNLQQEGSVEKAIQQIQTIVSDPTHRQEIPELAAKYRSPDRIREAYEYFFNQLQHKGL